MNTESRRLASLQRLIAYELPIEPTLEELRAVGWDSRDEFVQLKPSDFLNILDRFLGGVLSPEQVTDWADQLEMREDVGFQAPYEECLKEILFELANPHLRSPITGELLVGIKTKLLKLAE